MHTYFVTRGVEKCATEWKNYMQAQQFPWKRFSLNNCSCNHAKVLHNEGIECSAKSGHEVEHNFLKKDGNGLIMQDEKGAAIYEIKKIKIEKDCPCLKFNRREETTTIQGVLRPIQFWEYIHPKESLATVFAMQHSNQHNSTLLDQYKDMRSEMKPFAWAIRKALKLNKIPEDLKENTKDYFVPGYGVNYTNFKFQVNNVPIDGVGLYPIGIKEDVYGENEKFGYEQEML